jgi:hypothetical protein
MILGSSFSFRADSVNTVLGCGGEDGVSTSDCKSYYSDANSVFVPSPYGGSQALGTFTSFDTTGWTENYSTASSSAYAYFVSFALEDQAPIGDTYDQSISICKVIICAEPVEVNPSVTLAKSTEVAVSPSMIFEESISLGKSNGVYTRRQGQVVVPVANDFSFVSKRWIYYSCS